MSRLQLALDNEERASLALGAMSALRDLLAGQDTSLNLKPADFVYLFIAVERVVKEAIETPVSLGGVRCNDD